MSVGKANAATAVKTLGVFRYDLSAGTSLFQRISTSFRRSGPGVKGGS
ncbi:hypothetical protein [Novipirellula sp.]